MSPFAGRSIEFFEGEDGRLSMTRLLCFMSFFPASYVVAQDRNAETLSWYLGAYVLSYVGGKTADAWKKKAGGGQAGASGGEMETGS